MLLSRALQPWEEYSREATHINIICPGALSLSLFHYSCRSTNQDKCYNRLDARRQTMGSIRLYIFSTPGNHTVQHILSKEKPRNHPLNNSKDPERKKKGELPFWLSWDVTKYVSRNWYSEHITRDESSREKDEENLTFQRKEEKKRKLFNSLIVGGSFTHAYTHTHEKKGERCNWILSIGYIRQR